MDEVRVPGAAEDDEDGVADSGEALLALDASYPAAVPAFSAADIFIQSSVGTFGGRVVPLCGFRNNRFP